MVSARYFYFALPTHPLTVSLWLQSILCCCYLICTSVYCTHSAPSSWRVFKYSVRFVASGIVLQWRLRVPIVSPSGLRGVVPAMAATCVPLVNKTIGWSKQIREEALYITLHPRKFHWLEAQLCTNDTTKNKKITIIQGKLRESCKVYLPSLLKVHQKSGLKRAIPARVVWESLRKSERPSVQPTSLLAPRWLFKRLNFT